MNVKKILMAISVTLVLLLSSCVDPLSHEYDMSKSTKLLTDETTTQQVTSSPASILQSIESKDISTLYKVYDGTITKNANILLIAPGGPQFGDEPQIPGSSEGHDALKYSSPYDAKQTPGEPTNREPYVTVGVLQEQMIRTSNNTLAKDKAIMLSEASEINLHSSAILYAVAKHFKNKGHKVTLIAVSFGAFLALEMYRHYGDEPFQKSIIAVGRVDMPKKVYESFAENRYANFKSDGKTIQVGMKFENMLPIMMQKMGGCKSKNFMAAQLCKDGKIDDTLKKAFLVRQDTSSKLQAALGQNRYSKLLTSKDLSKIVYYSGAKDTSVGVLTDAEVNFLRGKGAAVTIIPNVGHGIHLSKSNEIRRVIENSFKSNILGTYEGTIDAMETQSLVARGGRSLSSIERLSFILALGTRNLIVQYRFSHEKNNTVRGSLWFGNKTNRSFEKGFDVIGTLKSTNSTTFMTLSANVRGRNIRDTLTVQENGKVLVDSAGNRYRKMQ